MVASYQGHPELDGGPETLLCVGMIGAADIAAAVGDGDLARCARFGTFFFRLAIGADFVDRFNVLRFTTTCMTGLGLFLGIFLVFAT